MNKPTEADLLVPFESEILKGQYKEFYKTKRDRFFTAVFELSDLWSYFQDLDEIWMREIGNIEEHLDSTQAIVGFLFLDAHMHFRTALELGFSAHIREANNVLRAGIESVGHAHKIYREPNLFRVWANANVGPIQEKAYETAFKADRKKNLFPPDSVLEELYDYWKRFSEWGVHTNLASTAPRFSRRQTSAGSTKWVFSPFETNRRRLALFLFYLLRASRLMERAFYDCFETRFKLDFVLVEIRTNSKRHFDQITNKFMKQIGPSRRAILP